MAKFNVVFLSIFCFSSLLQAHTEFDLLPKDSLVRQECVKDMTAYDCKELAKIIFCATTNRKDKEALCKDARIHYPGKQDFYWLEYHARCIVEKRKYKGIEQELEATEKELQEIINAVRQAQKAQK